MSTEEPQVSVVIPLLNEEESLPELWAWIKKSFDQAGLSFEVIWVDDGSKDGSWKIIQELCAADKRSKGIRFRRNHGKSAALFCGFGKASGAFVATMDADLQDNPEEIPLMVQKMEEDGLDLISGWKRRRYDPISKTIPSKFFNWVTRKMSGIELHDFNCGLKVYRSEVIRHIEVYGEMHRYIPVLAKFAGFTRIGEMEVRHQARKYGVTKFGLNRFVNGFLDLVSLHFMGRFAGKPMHFFGTMGVLAFVAGFGTAFWLVADKLYSIYMDLPYRPVTEQPLFYLGLTAGIVGAQLFLTGFLGEMLSRHHPNRNSFAVSAELGFDKELWA